ncbi:capsule assembly Wzi family protein [Dyadobacter chenhuakuii]|uniref:Capsule assembly Wzi family protein n=1 Tax=Dyadobacter chenhuakuii TaxID=2909339 RepID=A0ABY4XM19_9BACT|nr:capsule assembly Wzi family protein [Dyadobacter chenhuakuii]MCF2494178.1 capsule assembly Wzi family protein [Dyadobacter chenhuakuii]USJ31306.1 capsule assembly Wzi family protein [Dyadobacter chenhuakuii]
MSTFRFLPLIAVVLVAALPGLTHGMPPVSAAFQDQTTQGDTNEITSGGKAWVEFAGYGSTASRTPFWFHANQWGIVPTSGQILSLRAGVEARRFLTKDSQSKSNWSVVYGAEFVANGAAHSKFLIPQAYAGLAFKSFQLTVGRRKQYVGFNDNELGTGSYMWSGNALPIPRIQLGFENYVPLIKNFIYFKGFYSDGLLDGKRPVTSELKLHNKGLFVRLGKPTGTVQLHGGFNHAVQWGGKSPYFTENGQMPSGLDKYWYVITGFKPNGKLKDVSSFDNANRIGNHVASLDFGLELNLKSVNILFYRQNLIEDGSLFYLNNVKDGLNGVTFTMKNQEVRNFTLDKLTFEVLYTKSQGGSEAVDGNAIRGKDDYFNNAQVRDGWSYYGRGLGTPFITPQSENDWPRYADFFTNNNRVWVVHTGMKGKLTGAIWTTKLSLSSNQGTYDVPLPSKLLQFSGVVGLEKQVEWLGGSVIKGAVSADAGEFLDDAFGLMLSIRKNLSF